MKYIILIPFLLLSCNKTPDMPYTLSGEPDTMEIVRKGKSSGLDLRNYDVSLESDLRKLWEDSHNK